MGVLLISVSAATAQQKVEDGKANGNEGWQIEQRKKWWNESRGLGGSKELKQSQTLKQSQGSSNKDEANQESRAKSKARAKRAEAIRELEYEVELRQSADKAANQVWREIGASSMRMGNWVMGRVSGRINAIAPHPDDDDIVYVGTANGGVWKTLNGGKSWTPIFERVASQSIGSIYIDPDNPYHVWAGTGDKNHGDCAGYLSGGLFRSTDGGATWAARNGGGDATMQLSVINSVRGLPTDRDVILVGGFGDRCNDSGDSNGGLYRSTDRGKSWTQVLDQSIEDIVTIPASETVYASAPGQGVYKSTDGGATWNATGIITLPANEDDRLRLAVAASDDSVLYALSGGAKEVDGVYKVTGTLYRTDDGGITWSAVNTDACEGQCMYDLTLDVHPTDPETVLVGSIRQHRSIDGGKTFEPLTKYWGDLQEVHQDTHVVLYSRNNPERFWVGTDGGVWRTDDAGIHWQNMNANLNITQYYDIEVHPTDKSIVFGGAQDNSSSRRVENNVWDLTVVNGDGFMNAIDDTNTNIVFQNGYPSDRPTIYRSIEGGKPGTFEWQNPKGLPEAEYPWVTPTAVAGGYHFVGGDYISRANAAAATMEWTTISPPLKGTTTVITAMKGKVKEGTKTVDVVHVYAGTKKGAIYYSADAAAKNLSEVTGDYPGGWVSDIAIDPNDARRAFVTRSAVYEGSKLFRTTTAGGTWEAVGDGLPNIPASTVAIDPLNPDRIFVGTDVGVYESVDGGDTFYAFSTGLPTGLVVTDLEIDDDPYVLTAGTFGRGAWQMDLAKIGSDATAKLGMCDTGVPIVRNQGDYPGSKLIAQHQACLIQAGSHHAKYQQCMNRHALQLLEEGVLTSAEVVNVRRCVARQDLVAQGDPSPSAAPMQASR